MTIVWIIYGSLVGLLLAAAARALEGVCRIAGRPVRWVWAGALVSTVVLVGLAPLRRAAFSPPSPPALGPTLIGPAGSAEVAPSSSRGLTVALQVIRYRAATTIHRATAAISQRVPSSLDRYVTVVWLALSTLVLVLFAVVYARFRRMQRGWPALELCGVRVRLAPDGGPVVVGLSRSEIVVPRWLLRRSPDEQRLVLAHECEHVRARDPLLLAAACAIAALLPWHPAVWWMLSRLRLAIELDCDVRVLRQGVAPQTYGALLIDLAGRCSGLPVGVPALADNSSHLQQRLLAMTSPRLRFARARGSALSIFALLALLAACAVQVPVARAQDPVRKTADSAATDGTSGDTVTASPADSVLQKVLTRPDTSRGLSAPARVRLRGQASVLQANDPIVIVDGVRLHTTNGTSPLASIDVASIETVEVLKGPSAATLYGEDGANGVIVIITKKGRPE